MKQLIDDNSIIILQTRVNISRITRIFTFNQLAKDWGMSKATLYRYISPDYRELSRTLARVALKESKKIDRSKCFRCKQPTLTHERCPYCTILIHEKKCDCETRLDILQSVLI